MGWRILTRPFREGWCGSGDRRWLRCTDTKDGRDDSIWVLDLQQRMKWRVEGDRVSLADLAEIKVRTSSVHALHKRVSK